MIFDKLTKVSDAQAVTNTQASTDYIDLGVSRDIGNGGPLEFVCVCTSPALSGGASTVQVALQTDTQSSFATSVTLAQSSAIAKASVITGTELLRVKVPAGVQRYLRAFYTIGTTDLTSGNFTAGVILDRQAQGFYASGLNTSGF